MFSIAIAGLGHVGTQVVRQLQENAALIAARAGQPVVIKAVSARSKGKQRGCDLTNITWIDDPLALAALPDVDAVVELMGGSEGSARHLAETTLASGKHFITANKALLATHGANLAHRAEQHNAQIMFEAAVAGGIPVIKAVRESLAGDEIFAVRGILNGTCNYILSRMNDAAQDFAVALKEAQSLGYAEADPAADIDGHDSANKLALLSALVFGVTPNVDAVTVSGISGVTLRDMHYAAELGCCIKLLGVAEHTPLGIAQRVGACLVPRNSPLARVDGATNAVQIRGRRVGDVTLQGLGAGGAPTANAVVADILDLARGHRTPAFGQPVATLRQAIPTPSSLARYYVRMQVQDKPGVVADISSVLRDEAISIQSLLQHGAEKDGHVPVVLLTHHVENIVIKRAAEKISQLTPVVEKPCILRMEE